jgi:hypothetical protein
VQSGHFTVDPANAQGAPLRLSVPEGFRREQAAPGPASVEMGKARDFIQGEMTLDALCDELGLPRLPYLEEMPPEIDLA